MNLKYKDECVRSSYYIAIKFHIYKDGKPLEYGEKLGTYTCKNCYRHVEHTVGTHIYRHDGYGNNPKMKCSYCGVEYDIPDNYFEINIVGPVIFKNKYLWKNYPSFLFRYDALPYHGCRKNNHSKGGSSKKGLIFSSYKKSIDEQILDDVCTISFKDIKRRNVYRESGMESWDSSYRNRPRRSWKRTKKRKQWM